MNQNAAPATATPARISGRLESSSTFFAEATATTGASFVGSDLLTAAAEGLDSDTVSFLLASA